MRVTNSMMVNQLMYNISNNLDRMRVQQDQMATGKKIMRPSDDPIAASKILKYRTDLAGLDQYDRNTSDALSWLEVTESSVTNINEIMQRARELAVQAASGSNTPDDRMKIKAEFDQLKNDIISNGNASFAGRYLFSSYHTDQKFLRDDGSFNIDVTDYETTTRPSTKYQIGAGEDIQISTNGLDIFGAVKIQDPLMRSLPGSVIQGGPGVKEAGVFTVNPAFTTQNFSGVNISVNGIDYSMSGPDGSGGTPATQQQLLDGIKNAAAAAPSTNKLSDVADISLDSSGELIIRSKVTGDIGDIKIDISASSVPENMFTPERDGIYFSGKAATRSSVSYATALGYTFNGAVSLGGSSIDVGGTAYTIPASVDGTPPNSPLSLDQMMSGINSAVDGSGNRLDSVADVYMDADGSFVIKAKGYGNITIDTTLVDSAINTALGISPSTTLPTNTHGDPAQEASVTASIGLTSPAISPAVDFSSFAGKSYVVTLNGNTQKITLGMPITDAASLQASFQNAFNSKFSPIGTNASIIVGVGAPNDTFSFTTQNTPDGAIPTLEIRAITSTKPKLIQDFDDMISALATSDQTKISNFIAMCDENMNNLLTALADIGARSNRLDLVSKRISENGLTFTNLLSGVEDADIAQVVMNLKNSENVYNASLSAGAKIIQPTLVDFLR